MKMNDDCKDDQSQSQRRTTPTELKGLLMNERTPKFTDFSPSSSVKKKSVSFSYSDLGSNAKINNASDCLRYMRQGSELVKLRDGSRQYKRTYFLDEQMTCLRWNSSNKRQSRAQIHITEIHDIQLGGTTQSSLLNRQQSWRKQSSIESDLHSTRSSLSSSARLPSSSRSHSRSSLMTRQSSSDPDSCLFTITHGDDFDLLELMAKSPGEANIWVTGLKCLMAGAQDPQILEDIQKPRDRWIRCVFQEADSSMSGLLNELVALRLIHKLNPHLSSAHLKRHLKETNHKSKEVKNHLDIDDFVKLYKRATTRQEIYYILVRYSGGSEALNAEELRHFFDTEQGRPGMSDKDAHQLIQYYEPSQENRELGLLGIDGFSALLLSPECDIFDPLHLKVCQDMSQPITHYYLAASHKTYPLIVSIDCFASPDQQLHLVHLCHSLLGDRLLLPTDRLLFTLTDTHLDLERRPVDSHHRRSPSGLVVQVDSSDSNSLYSPDHQHVRWPSPRDLMGRILLKGRRQSNGHETSRIDRGGGGVTRKFMHSSTSGGHSSIIRELSDLFFLDSTSRTESVNDTFPTQQFRPTYGSTTSKSGRYSTLTSYRNESVPFHLAGASLGLFGDYASTSSSFLSTDKRSTSLLKPAFTLSKYASAHSCSHPYQITLVSEAEAAKALGPIAGELVQLTRTSLLQLHPSPSRMDSSNVNPIDVWAWGGQIVPLNYQTAGPSMDLATGFFARNGACGYVLKPALYRQATSLFTPCGDVHSKHHNSLEEAGSNLSPDTTPQILRLKLLGAQQLPKPKGSVVKGDTIEPYIVIEVHGIPVDCSEQRSSTASAGSAFAYNTTFDDSFEFCVQMGSLALIRFVVLDDHAFSDNFIGQNTIPFDCMLPGYRHIRLRSDTGEPIPLATLFVHISIIAQSKQSGIENSSSVGLIQKWRSRKKQVSKLKRTNNHTFDALFKAADSPLQQFYELRTNSLRAYDNFRRICGATTSTVAINECIRVLVSRLSSGFGRDPDQWPIKMLIRPQDDMPHLELVLRQSPNASLASFSVDTPSASQGGTSSLRRTPSLLSTNRLLPLRRGLRAGSVNKTLSVDVDRPLSGSSQDRQQHEPSPPLSVFSARRSSIQSSTSSLTSLSFGKLDKLQRAVNEFECLIETCKLVIKQGPYLRAKLQQVQKQALDSYAEFLDNLKDPMSEQTPIHSKRFIRLSKSPSDERSSSHRSLRLLTGQHRSTSSASVDETNSLIGGLKSTSKRRDSQDTNSSLSIDIRSSASSASSLPHPAGTSSVPLYWRRMSSVADSVTWNIRLLTGQIELLNLTHTELNAWIKQARDAGQATGLLWSSSSPTAHSNFPSASISRRSYRGYSVPEEGREQDLSSSLSPYSRDVVSQRDKFVDNLTNRLESSSLHVKTSPVGNDAPVPPTSLPSNSLYRRPTMESKTSSNYTSTYSSSRLGNKFLAQVKRIDP